MIGIHGNRRDSFKTDSDKQIEDFHRIAAHGNFCIAGDINMSFGDNYYHTNDGREKLNNAFMQLKLVNTTAGIPENIDHIILSEDFVGGREVSTLTWNEDKSLSDHIGVEVVIG